MDWNELVSALASVPALPGAVCRSRAPLFDATHDVANALDISRGTAAVALSRAARSGLILRVEKGVYSGTASANAIGVSA